jgi:hypothetical protein
MSTYDKYSSDVSRETWDLPMAGDTRFTWEYDDGRDKLLSLYQKGKDKQWDAEKRIDWSIDDDPNNPAGFPDEYNAFHGSDIWARMNEDEQNQLLRHISAWTFSQFMHGEQGAMVTSARIVESVPDLDAKFYAATQNMDEARHVETFARFLQEKVGLVYPMNDDLASLLSDALSSSDWDFAYLGMQVLIEGLALAAFGVYRDIAGNALAKQLLAYVMQDEARHVAFGRIALRDHYRELTDKERAEREDFVVEGCWLMRNRFLAQDVYVNLGLPVEECLEVAEHSQLQQYFRSLLFSRIVPCVKDIGLWGDKVQKCYADMGVLDMAGVDLDALMRGDEQMAEQLDAERIAVQRRADQVHETIAAAAD